MARGRDGLASFRTVEFDLHKTEFRAMIYSNGTRSVMVVRAIPADAFGPPLQPQRVSASGRKILI
jgi:hypothetical protein